MRTARFRPLSGLLMAAPIVLALSACNDKAKPDGARNAEGKVLQGSISDDMIAFDQLRSQGQQQEPEASESGAAPSDTATAGAEADGTPAAEPAEAPSADDEGTEPDEG